MRTERHFIEVSGIPVEVVRKPIKNLHLGVYPPAGRVRVAVPERMGEEAVRLAVVSRLGWIRRQQARFAEQPRESAREMVTGESHYLWGRRYRLEVIEHDGPCRVQRKGRSRLVMYVRPWADTARRRRLLEDFYRRELRQRIPALIEQWQPVIGVPVAQWGVKKMKTRWGSCNPVARRIWLNLELAKKPPRCLEYILVHEMVHLLEWHHNDRFRGLMGCFLPSWRLRRDELNSSPLGHEDWSY